MMQNRVSTTTLLVLVFSISTLFAVMIHQFLMAIFLAGLFSAMTSPFYQWLVKKLGGKNTLAAILTVFSLIAAVMVPFVVMLTLVVKQAIGVGQSVKPWIEGFIKEPSNLSKILEHVPFYENILPYRDVILQKTGELVGTVSSFLIDSLSSFTKFTFDAIFSSIIMCYVMFFFLLMGRQFLNKILYLLPLEADSEQILLNRFTSVARATIKGTLIIGFLQGALCGIAFTIVGIEGPVFWGAVMAVLSIVPAFGTAIVWFPALCIQLLTNNYFDAAILVVICGLVAGNLDNLLRPRLVGKDTEMHELFVLFGTLGGISMFGLIGIILGPIVTALFITIWDIYGEVFKNYLPGIPPPSPPDSNELE
jgi:predicted PurR-regulated permease PerM